MWFVEGKFADLVSYSHHALLLDISLKSEIDTIKFNRAPHNWKPNGIDLTSKAASVMELEMVWFNYN